MSWRCDSRLRLLLSVTIRISSAASADNNASMAAWARFSSSRKSLLSGSTGYPLADPGGLRQDVGPICSSGSVLVPLLDLGLLVSNARANGRQGERRLVGDDALVEQHLDRLLGQLLVVIDDRREGDSDR